MNGDYSAWDKVRMAQAFAQGKRNGWGLLPWEVPRFVEALIFLFAKH